ncbi:MAG: NAD(P)-dependent oxidoreductase [Clostridia bacterium]|nr:NAD(P)-dependent oxidoreductase [Clostridia bacterium]
MFTEQYLDELLSTPSQALIEDVKKLEGDIMILGAGGKVGPTLSLMAKRAVEAAGIEKRVIAVSRFSDPLVVKLLNENRVEMISADLTDPEQIAKLPRVRNIIFMVGKKFGTSGNACDTWTMNVSVPAMVTQHFRDANYVVFSTGNIYPLSPVSGCGSRETDAVGPVGEYAMTCLGRERIFEAAAKNYGAKVLMYRLNYAVDLRYGVLCDIAANILDGNPISVRTPCFNCVWQGYANEVAIRALTIANNPVEYLNVTGPETVSVKDAAEQLGSLLGRQPVYDGEETQVALLSNAAKCVKYFGYPSVGIRQMIEWQAEWLKAGGRLLGKPTHFEERKGNF